MHVGHVGGLFRIVLVSLIGIDKRTSCSHFFLPGASLYINIHLVECIFLFMTDFMKPKAVLITYASTRLLTAP